MKFNLWINLASKDLVKAKKFYQELGFEINKQHEAPHMVSMFVGKDRLVINLFDEKLMETFMGGQKVTNKKTSNEVLFSIGADSPEEVNQWANKVKSAGGELYSEPEYADGWMYGFGFIDPDGHRLNLLYMDMSKMPH